MHALDRGVKIGKLRTVEKLALADVIDRLVTKSLVNSPNIANSLKALSKLQRFRKEILEQIPAEAKRFLETIEEQLRKRGVDWPDTEDVKNFRKALEEVVKECAERESKK